MNRTILIHPETWNDLKLCRRKKWYISLNKELSRIYRLLIHDGALPGERPIRHLKLAVLQNKAFRAGINLPEENIGKRQGGRVVYIKESAGLLKILYIGGHKDKRYNDSHMLEKLIYERYQIATKLYKVYSNNLSIEKIA